MKKNYPKYVMFDVFQHLHISTIYRYFTEMKYLLNEGGHILVGTPFLMKEHQGIGTFFAQAYLTPSENEFIGLLNKNNYSWKKIDYYCRENLEGCFYIINNKLEKQ
jgi:hypothetical protein